MQRIIITEQDNTSNVEGLSSYDIVYVPGFVSENWITTEQSQKYFRTPTLVRSKYEFAQKFGNANDFHPTFSTDQPYPIATDAKNGFPAYAIPNFSFTDKPALISGYNNIKCDVTADPADQPAASKAAITGTGYYQSVEVDPAWRPEADIIYYVANGTTEGNKITYVMSCLTEDYDHVIFEIVDLTDPGNQGASPVERGWYYDDDGVKKPATESEQVQGRVYYYISDESTHYADELIFTSNFSPVDNQWMILYKNEYLYTSDTYIGFNTSGATSTTVKDYYEAALNTPIMFHGPTGTSEGDTDPGYRYALYLLSMGIPVYFEQMNSPFEVVNLEDPSNSNASPVEREWFIENGSGQYIRSTDVEVQLGTVYYTGADISVESMYRGLEARFGSSNAEYADTSFDSIGDYSVKYITSGGYPTFEYGPLVTSSVDGNVYGTSPLAQSMIQTANKRGDAVALIDHTNNPNRTIYDTDTYSVITRVRDEFASIDDIMGSYGAMFTPWFYCTHAAITGGTGNLYGESASLNQMPASLAFLGALSRQLQNYNPWLAVAGVSRGPVPYCGGLHTNFNLTNNVADSYQIIPGDESTAGQPAISINPITNIRNYGYCIWGNRTLRNNQGGTKSTSFLNIRDVVSDIKKRLYEASQSLLFEQNTDVLWLNFKNLVTPLLDTMKSNYILDNYSLVKYNNDPETGEPVPAYKVLAAIRIVPIASVEVFELQISLENREFSISEVE